MSDKETLESSRWFPLEPSEKRSPDTLGGREAEGRDRREGGREGKAGGPTGLHTPNSRTVRKASRPCPLQTDSGDRTLP